jgi:hypothetical protein
LLLQALCCFVSRSALNVQLTKEFTPAAALRKACVFKTLRATYDRGGKPTERSCAFPIGELKINAAIQALIAIGVTLWLLEAPDRIWPWFALGWACLAAFLNASLEIQEGTIASSAVFALFLGAPLAWAGWSVQPRGYVVLGWICIGLAGLLVAAVLVNVVRRRTS